MPEPGSSAGGRPARPAGRLVGQPDHAQCSDSRSRRAAQHQDVGAVSTCQLLGDVRGDPGVRGGGGRQHRDAGGQARPAACGSAGSPAGSRAPSRRCSAPRRPPPARRVAASSGSTSSRKPGLFNRSGRNQQHVDLAARGSRRAPRAHSSALAELIVTARMPARSAASIWLRINASSGEMITVGPAPPSRSSAVATKYTADLPQPVRCTTSARRCPAPVPRWPSTGRRAAARRRDRPAHADGSRPGPAGRWRCPARS